MAEKKKWTVKRAAVVLVAAVITVSAGAALAAPVGNLFSALRAPQTSEQERETTKPLEPKEPDAQKEKELRRQQKQKLEEAADLVPIPEQFLSAANTLGAEEGTGEDPRLRGYQKLCADKNMIEAEREILTGFIMEYPQQTQTLYILYDFFYDYFFTGQDLRAAMERCAAGEAVETVLETYMDIENSFEPQDIAPERVYYYVDECGQTPDDCAIAELLMFRGTGDFETVMQRLAGEDTWRQVGQELGLLNLSGQMRSLTVKAEEVQKAQQTMGLTEEAAVEKVAEAKKANVEEEDLDAFLTGRKSAGQALKQRSIETYEAQDGGRD